MRVRNVSYFLRQMEKNTASGPKNKEEVNNQRIAEYFAEKQGKKAA